jgi:hypothetical protein
MKEGAVERAFYDCRFRAAVLLLEAEMPDALGDALAERVASVVAAHLSEWAKDGVTPGGNLVAGLLALRRAIEAKRQLIAARRAGRES